MGESRYEGLVREAWRTGEYALPPAGPAGGDRTRPDESLREFLRSKMEWIVEREAYDPTGRGPREGSMKLAQFVKFREEKFGGVLFETRSEKVYTLSPTGAAVVREIATGGDKAAVLGRLKDRYEDPKGTMAAEAAEFISDLQSKGLVTE